MRKPSIAVIFLTVMIDLIGFGIVLPLLPLFSRDFGASGFVIGLIMATFSAMQFVFAPIWGRVSDRIGRRPVLLLSTFFACLSYIVFALGCTASGTMALGIFFVSRIVAGICGANISVAQAYIADITPPQDRSKRMGLIGMAFGLGFILGPALGAVSVTWFGIGGPGWAAAALCAINFVSAFLFLGESWRPNAEHVPQRPHFEQWIHTMKHPALGLLITVFFIVTFCFTSFETTLGLVVGANFNLDPGTQHDAKVIGYLFAYCGIIGAALQGGATGRLVRRLGEPRLIALSMLLLTAGLAALPYVRTWPALLAVLAALSAASNLTRPPVYGMLSIIAPTNEQGATIGVAQSAGSLARIIGPIFAGSLYQQHIALPYVTCAVLAFVTGIVCWRWLERHRPGV
jgi:DHA1 family tetracycline resistance protein-like MFS transporter